MKIFYSAASPYVRKCMAVAHHLNLADRIEKLPSKAHPVDRDRSIIEHNPLGKVPTLVTDDGLALYDSRVICEYLDALGNGGLFPKEGRARWQALADQALADGLLDAALLLRYEVTARAETLRSKEWQGGQMDKIVTSLARAERAFGEAGASPEGRTDIGTITLGCALGYLDFRFADFDWRKDHPKLAAWYSKFAELPAMKATEPKA